MSTIPSESAAASGESPAFTKVLAALRRLHDGDLTVQLSPEAGGVSPEIADVFNRHVHFLNEFAQELTRISREMGTESRYGGQMEVPGASGTWKDLVVNVNLMAANLTDQIRDLHNVTQAVSEGDMSKRVTLPCQGEMAGLHDTVNHLIEEKRIGLTKQA